MRQYLVLLMDQPVWLQVILIIKHLMAYGITTKELVHLFSLHLVIVMTLSFLLVTLDTVLGLCLVWNY